VTEDNKIKLEKYISKIKLLGISIKYSINKHGIPVLEDIFVPENSFCIPECTTKGAKFIDLKQFNNGKVIIRRPLFNEFESGTIDINLNDIDYSVQDVRFVEDFKIFIQSYGNNLHSIISRAKLTELENKVKKYALTKIDSYSKRKNLSFSEFCEVTRLIISWLDLKNEATSMKPSPYTTIGGYATGDYKFLCMNFAAIDKGRGSVKSHIKRLDKEMQEYMNKYEDSTKQMLTFLYDIYDCIGNLYDIYVDNAEQNFKNTSKTIIADFSKAENDKIVKASIDFNNIQYIAVSSDDDYEAYKNSTDYLYNIT
jgi:hypothetical protein